MLAHGRADGMHNSLESMVACERYMYTLDLRRVMATM